MSDKEKAETIKKANGIFEMRVKSPKKEGVYTIDMKKVGMAHDLDVRPNAEQDTQQVGEVYQGPAKPKADVTISLGDDTFQQLADGKLNGQKAFMSGKLKVKGMCAICSCACWKASMLYSALTRSVHVQATSCSRPSSTRCSRAHRASSERQRLSPSIAFIACHCALTCNICTSSVTCARVLARRRWRRRSGCGDRERRARNCERTCARSHANAWTAA